MKKLLLLAFALPSLALAQPPGSSPCILDAGLEAPLAQWRSPISVAGPLSVGAAGTVFTGRPLTIEIAEGGTYGVALGIPAWIEVARDGRVVVSTGHGHGPRCSSIRKIVDFRLEPGTYTITLNRTDADSARILVFRR